MQARKMIVAAVGLAAIMMVAAGAMAVNIETVPVGDIGNAADTAAHSGNAAGQGSVGYTYNIGKYEVTAGQYTAFLNAVAATDTYSLYNTNMDTTVYSHGCNIKRAGSAGSYTYSVTSDWANRPVNMVSYWDSCRFANWLNNGQPTGAQGAGTTETGTYTLGGYNGQDGRTIQRNAGATWAVTSEDEWYKAAYYKGGSTSAGYWDYPTRSNTAPSNVGSDGYTDPGNHANYYIHFDVYTISSPYYRTNVGEFENSASPYGTFDQGGNVMEWNEAIPNQGSNYAYRGGRGGSFDDDNDYLLASSRYYGNPAFEDYFIGFRVSEVPEPATAHAGDANNDGAVNVIDLGVLAKYYDTAAGATWAMADFSGDGAVNVIDLGVLAKNYDWVGTPAGAVPEPATLSLLALGGLALLRRRRD